MPTLIPAAGRAMALFEVFAREKRDLSNSEMARLLSLPESSTSDLLHTLHSLGYLMRTARNRRFYPTARLFDIAGQIAENDPLGRVAREAVQQLGSRTNETAFFGVLDTRAVKIVAVQPSREPLRYIVEVGARAALNASAMGKAILSQLPAGEARTMLGKAGMRKVTPHTVVDVDTLMEQVAKGGKRGWCDAREEGSEGVYGLAVAGWMGGQPAGISLAGPAERMKKNHAAYLEALIEVRDALMRQE